MIKKGTILKPRSDKTGLVFHFLTVLSYGGYDEARTKHFWKCKCICGNIIFLGSESVGLRSGCNKSCGCRQHTGDHNRTHGESGPGNLLFTKWTGMIRRTTLQFQKLHPAYTGVKVSDTWKHYARFKFDMGVSFFCHVAKHGIKNTTLERIDNAHGYSQNNCCWATIIEQANNKRNVRKINTSKGLLTIPQASRIFNVNYKMLRDRLLRYGWETERALSLKSGGWKLKENKEVN